jgi:hypothetical protein
MHHPKHQELMAQPKDYESIPAEDFQTLPKDPQQQTQRELEVNVVGR